MTAEEVNKTIAEFMGFVFYDDENKWYEPNEGFFIDSDYFQSLDRLVPVWEKLQIFETEEEYTDNQIYFQKWHDGDWLFDFGYLEKGAAFSSNSLQKAAAIATAKVIKELK